MTFGEKLQSLRKQRGLSQEQLASQLAISRQAISKWELDSSMPDTENIIQLSKLFHVTTDYLLHDEIMDTDGATMITTNITEPIKKRFEVSILGILFSSVGFIGVLTIGILSSIYPAVIHYPQEAGIEVELITRTGLPAFLETNNLKWLFILFIAAVFIGIIIVVYPTIKAKFKKHK